MKTWTEFNKRDLISSSFLRRAQSHRLREIFRTMTLIFFFSYLVFCPRSWSYASQPGFNMVTAPPVSPEQARTILGQPTPEVLSIPEKGIASLPTEELGVTQQQMLLGLATSETEITPEIETLARGLQNDPKRIYEYVRNHIDYVPTFGSVNGATATLLAGRGNDFDQASLLIALMRASGYTANYVFGDVTYTLADMANWLGVDENRDVVGQVVASGGIPVTVYTNDYVKMARVWVKVTIEGADYVFDPAFKQYEYTSGINVPQAMVYNESNFFASATAGATIGSDYVQNMNAENIKSELQTYSSNLLTYIRNNHPNASVREIIGGRNIQHEELEEYPTTLPHAVQIANQTDWSEIPGNYRLKVRIQHVGIDSTFASYEIAGKRISIFYTGSGNAPELKVDGALIASGNPTTSGSTYDLKVWIDHPYAGYGGTYADQNDTFKLKSGASYSIAGDFEGVSKNLIRTRNTILTENRLSGVLETSEPILGETLWIMGLTWLHECRLSNVLMARLAEVSYVHHHSVGVMAQEEGYYIDVKISLVSVVSIHGNRDDAMAWFRGMGGLASGFEHGMLEQLQGKDKPGASTVKLLYLSNSNSKKTFYADSTNYPSIRGQLQNYSQSKLDELQSVVNAGFKLILPGDANIALNQWTGLGYIQTYSDAGSASVGMIIAGHYNGGYSGYQGPVDVPTVHQETTITVPDISTQAHITTPKSIEPVDMASGAYLHNHRDLSMGKPEPLGLRFARFYNSTSNYQKRSLGYGWTHNYDIYLEEHSDGDPGLGERLPADAVDAIAGVYVAFDLMKNHDDLQGWLVSCITHKWTVDQLIENGVTIHLGNKSLEFVKLPDDTYSSPPGITAELIDNGDTFTLKERYGITLQFNTENRISSWSDADGNSLSFSYSQNKLSTIHDAFSRTLNLTYNGDTISVVSDSTGRSVSYDYDPEGNLESYTDPAGKLWAYGYDANHRMTSLTNPLGITTATNTYDSLGRVDTQTVPRQGSTTVTYNFYFSRFRNLEEDSEGNRTMYYFDERGRNIGEENALGHKTTREFDGQDHIVKATDPRSNSTIFEYDNQHNLIKITNALQYETNYVYDGQFRPTVVIDPLGHSIHFDYDSEHHLIETTTYPQVGQEIQANATYYSNGLASTATDGRGTVTTMTYDSYGNARTVQVASEPAVTYVYDPIGRMVNLTDQATSTTSFSYDNRGLVMSRTDPLDKTTSYTYYDDGTLHTTIDRKNDTVSYSYTPSGKLDTISYPDLSTVSFIYDLRDNLREMHDSLGTTTYTYDAANRLTSVTDPHGFSVSYEYDEAGNLTELTYPGNKKVSYNYDELNHLETVTINWLSKTATYHYDGAGRLTRLDQFNNAWTAYGYDKANRLTDLENRRSDSSVIATYHFTLDDNGNRTGIDQVEPLAPAFNANLTDYTYNGAKNRLLTAGAYTFTYDFEGQLESKDSDANDFGPQPPGSIRIDPGLESQDSNAYDFDYEHRLVGVSGGDSSQYGYDGTGNRLQATRNSVTSRYVYDAFGNLLAEADENNTVTHYFIYGYGLLATVSPAGEVYCYHFNAVGSTVAITDQSQQVANSYAYSPFGIIANEQENLSQPFKFVGQHGVMTEPNGFYYMRARYYDPQAGRFISEDPIGFAGGDVNLYGYVTNNPINRIDPWGLKTWQIGFGFNAGGLVGSTKSVGIIIGHNPKTGDWDIGVYATGGAGLHGGASASFTIDITTSDNPLIDDVSGWAGTAGGSVDVGASVGYERNTPITDALPSNTYSFGVGAGTPAEGHGYATYTKVWGSNK